MNRQVSIKQVQVANVHNTENTMMVDSGVKSWVKKLTSRKFLMAMVPAIAAICAMFGYSENQDRPVGTVKIRLLRLHLQQ